MFVSIILKVGGLIDEDPVSVFSPPPQKFQKHPKYSFSESDLQNIVLLCLKTKLPLSALLLPEILNFCKTLTFETLISKKKILLILDPKAAKSSV